MKTFHLIVLVCICSFISNSVNGQEIPNSGFENWAMINGILEPDEWTTNNTQTQNEPSVTRSTNAFSGQYAIRVKPTLTIDNTYHGEASIEIQSDTMSSTISFHVKQIQEGNVANNWVQVKYYSNNMLLGYQLIGSTASSDSYHEMVSQINYPDSTDRIVLKIISTAYQPDSNSKIWVDDIKFLETATRVINPSVSKLKIYPNPAVSQVFMEGEQNIGSLKIFDTSGRLVFSKNIATNETQIDISSLRAGFYTLLSESGTQKLMVKE